MAETVLTLLLAFALGVLTARLLHWRFAEARRLRVSVLALIPLALLLAVFLVFFEGRPEGEDWFWLAVGLMYIWPWYLAWGLGAGVEALARTRRASRSR